MAVKILNTVIPHVPQQLRGCDPTEEPVLGWSPLLAPRYYQGLDYKHMSQSTGAGVLEPALEENDLCLSTSSALSQLTTDHQPKLRQNQMTSAVPVPRAHTVTPRAHPCTSAISYTTPHPMARLLPSVETAPEAASCLTPDRATPVQKPSTSLVKPSDKPFHLLPPSFHQGPRTAASAPHRPWHIVHAQ